ncbi:MAG TPA: hypothetical protein VIS72_11880 [Anaerolineales bacterium]
MIRLTIKRAHADALVIWREGRDSNTTLSMRALGGMEKRVFYDAFIT